MGDHTNKSFLDDTSLSTPPKYPPQDASTSKKHKEKFAGFQVSEICQQSTNKMSINEPGNVPSSTRSLDFHVSSQSESIETSSSSLGIIDWDKFSELTDTTYGSEISLDEKAEYRKFHKEKSMKDQDCLDCTTKVVRPEMKELEIEQSKSRAFMRKQRTRTGRHSTVNVYTEDSFIELEDHVKREELTDVSFEKELETMLADEPLDDVQILQDDRLLELFGNEAEEIKKILLQETVEPNSLTERKLLHEESKADALSGSNNFTRNKKKSFDLSKHGRRNQVIFSKHEGLPKLSSFSPRELEEKLVSKDTFDAKPCPAEMKNSDHQRSKRAKKTTLVRQTARNYSETEIPESLTKHSLEEQGETEYFLSRGQKPLSEDKKLSGDKNDHNFSKLRQISDWSTYEQQSNQSQLRSWWSDSNNSLLSANVSIDRVFASRSEYLGALSGKKNIPRPFFGTEVCTPYRLNMESNKTIDKINLVTEDIQTENIRCSSALSPSYDEVVQASTIVSADGYLSLLEISKLVSGVNINEDLSKIAAEFYSAQCKEMCRYGVESDKNVLCVHDAKCNEASCRHLQFSSHQYKNHKGLDRTKTPADPCKIIHSTSSLCPSEIDKSRITEKQYQHNSRFAMSDSAISSMGSSDMNQRQVMSPGLQAHPGLLSGKSDSGCEAAVNPTFLSSACSTAINCANNPIQTGVPKSHVIGPITVCVLSPKEQCLPVTCIGNTSKTSIILQNPTNAILYYHLSVHSVTIDSKSLPINSVEINVPKVVCATNGSTVEAELSYTPKFEGEVQADIQILSSFSSAVDLLAPIGLPYILKFILPAENANICLTYNGKNELEFFNAVEGTTVTDFLTLVNYGRAAVTLHLQINEVTSENYCFCFDMTETTTLEVCPGLKWCTFLSPRYITCCISGCKSDMKEVEVKIPITLRVPKLDFPKCITVKGTVSAIVENHYTSGALAVVFMSSTIGNINFSFSGVSDKVIPVNISAKKPSKLSLNSKENSSTQENLFTSEVAEKQENNSDTICNVEFPKVLMTKRTNIGESSETAFMIDNKSSDKFLWKIERKSNQLSSPSSEVFVDSVEINPVSGILNPSTSQKVVVKFSPIFENDLEETWDLFIDKDLFKIIFLGYVSSQVVDNCSQYSLYSDTTTFDIELLRSGYLKEECEIIIFPAIVKFSMTDTNLRVTNKIVVRNHSFSDLQMYFQQLDPPFQVGRSSVVVKSKKYVEVPISFNPDKEGSYVGLLNVACQNGHVTTVHLEACFKDGHQGSS